MDSRHHGTPGEPVQLELATGGGMAILQVRNVAAPFSAGLALDLFQPFKRELPESSTNRNGLGLGLYIAERVVAGHGGRLAYQYQHPHVMFTASFALAQGQS